MKVKALEKEWEVKPITPKRQQELFSDFLSCYPETDKNGEYLREQTPLEKKMLNSIYFECVELSGVEPPKNLIERMTLGIAIMSEYLDFDKKKLSEQESQDG